MKPREILKKLVIYIYYAFIKVLSVSDSIIYFESSVGRNYSGNPKYVYEEMVRQGLDKEFKCVWSLENPQLKIPGNAVKVKRTRLKYLYYLARAKIWVCDTRQPSFLIKRLKTTYIQLWHGTPLKKLAMDLDLLHMSEELDLETYKNLFLENTRTWDYLISQSSYTTEKFRSCFTFENPILEIGFPRNDVLFHKNNHKTIDELKMKYHIPRDKKIILYAPTWRDDEYIKNGVYKFSSQLDFNRLMEELKYTHILLVKLHYLVGEKKDWEKFKGFIYECDNLQDIQELYLISDILITDYSSVMFDYAILRRPMVIYAPDYYNYKDNLRGLYFDVFKEFPGPVVQTTPDLIWEIKNYNPLEYEEKYETFQNKYTNFEDGNASKKIVDLILEKTGQK